jgi:hypothetical protein
MIFITALSYTNKKAVEPEVSTACYFNLMLNQQWTDPSVSFHHHQFIDIDFTFISLIPLK